MKRGTNSMTDEWLFITNLEHFIFFSIADDRLCDTLAMFLFFTYHWRGYSWYFFRTIQMLFKGIQVELECGKVLISNQFRTTFSNETAVFMYEGLYQNHRTWNHLQFFYQNLSIRFEKGSANNNSCYIFGSSFCICSNVLPFHCNCVRRSHSRTMSFLCLALNAITFVCLGCFFISSAKFLS